MMLSGSIFPASNHNHGWLVRQTQESLECKKYLDGCRHPDCVCLYRIYGTVYQAAVI